MTEQIFKENILPLNSKLLGFANKFMNDLDDSKDVVQEIYLKLWRIRKELDQYNSIEALAMRMTRNLCLDKIKLKKTVPLNNVVKDEEKSDDSFNEEQQQEIKIAANRAQLAINTLDEPQRTIMQLRDIQGFDYEEIGQILNMNVNTVRVNLSRARKKVREYLLTKYYNHGSKKIKALLEKYYKGESTSDDEKILIEYFNQDDISDELLADRDIFSYNRDEKKNLEDMPDMSAEIWDSLQKSSKNEISKEKKLIYWAFRIAAGIVILIASFVIIKSQLQENQNGEYQFADTYENPEEAYEQAKQTLLYVSAMLNNGTEHLEPINKINESTQKLSPLTSFNSGLNELNQLKKYEIANKYIKQ